MIFDRNYNVVIKITILLLFQKLEFLGSYSICAPSAIVKDKIVKFSKNCGTFAIK